MNMLMTKCDCCNADVFFAPEQLTSRCIFCRKTLVRPASQGEPLRELERANELWADCRFDEAAPRYQAVLAANPDEYEARWKLMLCKYGVEYVTEELTGRQYIICHIARPSSLRNEPEYRRAWDLAPAAIRAQYEQDAAYIDGAQAEIGRLRDQDARPYEVFICFKDRDDQTGNRTDDSVYAESIYHRLTDLGYAVFYSNISLNAKAGEDYEAAIHRAIETAKVMLVIGTRAAYYEATWVRSEWSRFLKRRAETDPDKLLIPLYRRDPLTMPAEFRNMNLQGIDLVTDYLTKLETRLDSRLRKAERDQQQMQALQEQKRQADEANQQLQERIRALEAQLAMQSAAQAAAPAESPADKGLRLYREGRYADALAPLTQAAEAGHTEAQKCLGRMYVDGAGVPANPYKGLQWFYKATESNDAEAQYQVGRMYDIGLGGTVDKALAEKWYDLAAEQGHSAAAKQLEALRRQPAVSAPYAPPVAAVPVAPVEPVAQDSQRTQRAIALFDSKQYDSAMKLFQETAGQGDAQAERYLGLMYEQGQGVIINMARAAEWYRKAAEHGDDKAQVKLGRLYQRGDGVPQDAKEALRWYRRAAEQGNATARGSVKLLERQLGLPATTFAEVPGQAAAARPASVPQPAAAGPSAQGLYDQGMHYLRGEGVMKDEAQAARLLRQAADQGHPRAQDELGTMYRCGLGGLRADPEEAYRWFHRAAQQGDASAQDHLGALLENGVGVKRNLQEALRWYRKAADQGLARALTHLGAMYENGTGVGKDIAQAARYYAEAAGQGDSAAQRVMGRLCLSGQGVKEDAAQARRWFEAAATAGDPEAQAQLGVMLREGRGMQPDSAAAFRWLYEAARQEQTLAQAHLGIMYLRGEGTQRDAREAFRWLRMAADHNDSLAQYHLGMMYESGLGVRQSMEEAIAWYSRSSAPDAYFRLGQIYEHGIGVAQDGPEALAHYERAALLGHREAQQRVEQLEQSGKAQQWRFW